LSAQRWLDVGFLRSGTGNGELQIQDNGGVGGIRTLDTAFQPYNGLANRRLQPLGHDSVLYSDYVKSFKTLSQKRPVQHLPLGNGSIRRGSMMQPARSLKDGPESGKSSERPSFRISPFVVRA
jgi:hypothetical protein